MSGPSTPSKTPPPPPSVSVSKTTQEQTADTQKPVAEPIPQSPTRDSLVAQEPVSMFPEQIPDAVPELELPSHVQYQSETISRNTPIRDLRNILMLRTLSSQKRFC